MDDVDELVITSFREIVEKGKQAIENAGDQQPIMAKAAQALVKEGERGLKRIEPLCRKHVEDYGHSFVAALKDNGKPRISRGVPSRGILCMLEMVSMD